ncbi:MAG: MBOAT family protein [Clostridia bacterium]|nr:MBOAT family protein [Clostridia bacterium]
MSIVSIEFLIFIAAVLLAYYLVPGKIQWIVLLLASYCFYFLAGVLPLLFVMATTALVYGSGRRLEKIKDEAASKKEAKAGMKKTLVITMVMIFGTLLVLKYFNFVADNISGILNMFSYSSEAPLINIILPLGISFYMFQAIGYCIDIYRGKIKAEQNILRFALFISFFPQAIQGPISRYDNLGTQLREVHRFSYENLTFGAQLMVWGFVKKMVIADRLAIPVSTVFDNYQDFDGTQIFIAIVLYALQIYADFSGGIDIIRGAAECMGIRLIENFQRPYFGDSVAEYWRRWHISLTSWMRDYVFYPLALSKMSSRIGKWSRNRFKAWNIGKQMPSYIPTFVTFFLIGIWHGAGWGFIVFGLYNATIITLSMMFTEGFRIVNEALHINVKNPCWKAWQIIRTFAIMAIGKCLTRAVSVGAGLAMLKESIHVFNFHGLLGRACDMGLDLDNWLILALALILFFIVSVMQERGINLRKKIAEQILPVRWVIYMAGILAIIIFGVYGPGYEAASFIYRGF